VNVVEFVSNLVCCYVQYNLGKLVVTGATLGLHLIFIQCHIQICYGTKTAILQPKWNVKVTIRNTK